MQWNQLVDEDNLLEKLNTKEGGGLDIKVVRTSYVFSPKFSIMLRSIFHLDRSYAFDRRSKSPLGVDLIVVIIYFPEVPTHFSNP